MKSKLFVLPILGALVFGPALSAFAQTPAVSKTEQAEKGQKGKMEKEGDKKNGANFCANISTLEAKMTTKVGEKSDKMMEKREGNKSEFDKKRADHVAKMTDTRAQHDAKFTARVEEMKAKMTNVDPAKIDQFQKEMMAAVGERRSAIDTEMSSFVKEVDSAKLAKSAEVTKALEVLKTDIATATTKAKDSCNKEGADSVAIAASFKADMKVANDKFRTTVSTLKDGAVKELRNDHKEKVEGIRNESEKKLQEKRGFWKSLFGKKAPKATEAPAQ